MVQNSNEVQQSYGCHQIKQIIKQCDNLPSQDCCLCISEHQFAYTTLQSQLATCKGMRSHMPLNIYTIALNNSALEMAISNLIHISELNRWHRSQPFGQTGRYLVYNDKTLFRGMLYWRISSDLFCVWQILSIHGDNNTVLTFFALHLFNTAIKPYSRHTAMQNPPHTHLAPCTESKTKQVGKMFAAWKFFLLKLAELTFHHLTLHWWCPWCFPHNDSLLHATCFVFSNPMEQEQTHKAKVKKWKFCQKTSRRLFCWTLQDTWKWCTNRILSCMRKNGGERERQACRW